MKALFKRFQNHLQLNVPNYISLIIFGIFVVLLFYNYPRTNSDSVQFYSILITVLFASIGLLLYRFNSLDNKKTEERVEFKINELKNLKEELQNFQYNSYPIFINTLNRIITEIENSTNKNKYSLLFQFYLFKLIIMYHFINIIYDLKNKNHYYAYWVDLFNKELNNFIDFFDQKEDKLLIHFEDIDIYNINVNLDELIQLNSELITLKKDKLIKISKRFNKE